MEAKRTRILFVLKHVSGVVGEVGRRNCSFPLVFHLRRFTILLYRNQQVNIVVLIFMIFSSFSQFSAFSRTPSNAKSPLDCPLSLELSDFSSSAVRSLYHEVVAFAGMIQPNSILYYFFLLALAETQNCFFSMSNCKPTVFTRSYYRTSTPFRVILVGIESTFSEQIQFSFDFFS
jgi:hypothetical protein